MKKQRCKDCEFFPDKVQKGVVTCPFLHTGRKPNAQQCSLYIDYKLKCWEIWRRVQAIKDLFKNIQFLKFLGN